MLDRFYFDISIICRRQILLNDGMFYNISIIFQMSFIILIFIYSNLIFKIMTTKTRVRRNPARKADKNNYSIKDMDRPSPIVETKHGLFLVRAIDAYPRENNTPICTGCWYQDRDKTGMRRKQRSGAPCSPGTQSWCGDYVSILIPKKLNNEGKELL